MHLSILYVLMLTGFLAGRNVGHLMIPVNIGFLILINHYTKEFSNYANSFNLFDNKAYALSFHSCLTILLGGIFSFIQKSYEKSKKRNRKQQLTEITLLNEMVKERTQELQYMKQNFASYFHDETGNRLAAISQQASVLRMKLNDKHPLLPVIENIYNNCEQLYSSSKDLLWSINNDSHSPIALFSHLTAYGQYYFNQFEIAFSSRLMDEKYYRSLRVTPLAAKDLIYIFKEAMTNTARYSGAQNVTLEMAAGKNHIRITLRDNGVWKKADPGAPHSGLRDIERRSRKNNFGLTITTEPGTAIEINVPVSSDFFSIRSNPANLRSPHF